MLIGSLQIELMIPDSNSLKQKRYVLSSIKQRLRNKFNVSVAEVDHQDLWQRSVIGVVMVGNKQKFLTEAMQKILYFVDEQEKLEITDHIIEIL